MEIDASLRAIVARARVDRQRGVLPIAGDRPWREELLRSLSSLGLTDVACVGADGDRKAKSLLGAEVDAVVLDWRERLDPEALGAVHGAIRAGGVLILRVPEQKDFGSRFGAHVARVLAALLRVEPSSAMLPPLPAPTSGTEEQRRAVERLAQMIEARDPQPIVLVADRGRGKSAALGIAAGRAIALGMDVRVIAPNKRAIESLERFARRDAGVDEKNFAREFRFVEASSARAERDPSVLFLVDEAAALPVAVLRELSSAPRIAFATTVHGYEGTGRGFTERFLGALRARRPASEILELREPIRWSAGDPLERFAFDALLLDAAPAKIVDRDQPIRYAKVDREALSRDDALLRELFGLLVAAHYRTTPRDLVALLDAPNVAAHALFCGAHPVAAALVSMEGGLSHERTESMMRGVLRPAGHAIPETLVAHCRRAEGGRQRGVRVVRIAVHPALQHGGLGTRLLAEIAREAEAAELDWIGALFGATPDLLAFWMRSGFLPVRISVSRGASTGEHSVLVLKACSRRAQALITELRAAWAEDLPHQLGDALREIDPALVLTALRGAPWRVPHLSEREIDQLVACAFGGLAHAVAASAVFELVAATVHAPNGELDDLARGALVMRVLQRRRWEELVGYLGVESVPFAMRALRAALRPLVLAHAGASAAGLARAYRDKEPARDR